MNNSYRETDEDRAQCTRDSTVHLAVDTLGQRLALRVTEALWI